MTTFNLVNVQKSYQFAIRPTKEQEALLNKHMGCVRFAYNHFLNERIEQYKKSKTSDNYYGQAASLTKLKRQDATVWLKEVNSQSLQMALRNLETAFVNFFEGRAQFPRFKSKKKRNSFTVPQFVVVADKKVYFPKFKEGIRFVAHREIKGLIKRCTISKSPTGKFFISILCEVEHEPVPQTQKEIGIDLGIKDLIVTSDGIRFTNHRFLKQYETALTKAQRHLSRKVKGSANWEKQRLKVAVLHEKIANTRLDLLHKISTRIINEYDTICVEDLNVKGMMANHKLAKHIADASWGTFVNLLEYKAAWNDRQLIRVGRFYPSSKTCNQCGDIYHDLKLSERTWTCRNGHVLDRDINASKNILEEGMKIIGTELSDYTDGGLNETSKKKHKPEKSEAPKSLV